MVFIIAECGINHNGDLDIAKQLIDMAIECGCDAVKFQKRNPDVCVPDKQKDVMMDTPWGNMTYLEYKKKLEFGEKEYDEIDRYCKEKQIEWFASAWDLDSLKFLRRYNLKYLKVPSVRITSIDFLKEVAFEAKKTFISTGMCTIKDIDRAVDVFGDFCCPFVLNHCVSTYPTDVEDLNLNMIKTLQDRYGCEVGYSGHERDILPSVLAAMLGAKYIERHITLDRAMWGTDQSASLEKRGLELLCRDTKLIDICLGDGVKRFSVKEKDVAAKQRGFLRGFL